MYLSVAALICSANQTLPVVSVARLKFGVAKCGRKPNTPIMYLEHCVLRHDIKVCFQDAETHDI